VKPIMFLGKVPNDGCFALLSKTLLRNQASLSSGELSSHYAVVAPLVSTEQ
jgi:hypothetical protein